MARACASNLLWHQIRIDTAQFVGRKRQFVFDKHRKAAIPAVAQTDAHGDNRPVRLEQFQLRCVDYDNASRQLALEDYVLLPQSLE